MGNQDVAAPHRSSLDADLIPGDTGELDAGGVGMGFIDVAGGELESKSLLLSDLKTLPKADVIRLHPQDPGYQCLVGAVSPVGLGK